MTTKSMETNEWKEEFRNTFGKGSEFEKFLTLKYGTTITHLKAEELILDYISQNFIPISELKRWVEENEALTRLQIPDDSGTLKEALDKRDILMIVFCFQHILTDTHNSALKALKDKYLNNE